MFAVRLEKNARQTISLSCVEGKTHDKQFFCRTFFRLALWRRRTTKILFAVRPKENARQRFSRTANLSFPVVTPAESEP
jgi:hypothetical protein